MSPHPTTDRSGPPEAVRSHYDVGNAFYRLWLDPTLTYSCALWEERDTDDLLELAQRRKLAYHARQARAGPGTRVLDIGCGWGSLLRHLVEEAGVGQAVGLTLSPRQAGWVGSLRLPRAEARLEGWAEHAPASPYDAVICVGAFEHFADPAWPEERADAAYRAFFGRCHGFLRPGGWLSLQTIAYGDLDRREARASPEARFLSGEVFPGSELPTLEQVVRASDGLVELVALRNDREDYARTCQVWCRRLVARRAEAVALVGEAVVSRYVRYLKLSGALFHLGRVGLLRLSFRRVDGPRADAAAPADP
jgi:cyclopropane-fatty-acyl-phospholipid synthase